MEPTEQQGPKRSPAEVVIATPLLNVLSLQQTAEADLRANQGHLVVRSCRYTHVSPRNLAIAHVNGVHERFKPENQAIS